MKLQLTSGNTDVSLIIFIRDTSSATGLGLTGLVYNTSGLVCYYVHPESVATQLTLASVAVAGVHTNGGFVEIDATNMPGWYRLDLSDTIVEADVSSVGVYLSGAANMAPNLTEIQLDAQNPQDSGTFDFWITDRISFRDAPPKSGSTGDFERWITDRITFADYVVSEEAPTPIPVFMHHYMHKVFG